MAKAKKSKGKRERRERRFEPRATTPRGVVLVIGGLGATLLGAGICGQFGPMITPSLPAPLAWAPWVVAGGAVLLGIAIWFGTSGDAAIRVGDPGVTIERGGLRRFPWYNIDEISSTPDVIRVSAKSESSGTQEQFTVSLKSQPNAAAWILKEARDRVPEVVHTELALEADSEAGTILSAAPIQLVGKRCASSGKVIAFEPDARVCTRCERVFHREHAPKTCLCGATITQTEVATAEA